MDFTEIKLEKEYRTLISKMSKEFYAPILNRAERYDRAVGFFSSSSLSHIASGLIPFAKNGGYMRLIASPVLSEEDIEAIKEGYRKREEIIQAALERELVTELDEVKGRRLNLLANLIADNRLDIKIVLTENADNYGIYHEKMGLFYDRNDNVIAFSGSMNESVTGMSVNYETVDVFCSWTSEDEKERIKKKQKAFEALWTGVEPNVSTWDLPEIKDSILKKYQREKIDYNNISEAEIEEKFFDDDEEVIGTNNSPVIGARIPVGFNLFDYQEKAINSWEENGFKGIFDMATGTGKTYTGLGAVSRLSVFLKDKLGVVISCPYQHLVEQWVEDIVKFNIDPIVGYGSSKQKTWKKDLENAIRDQKLGVKGKSFFCFITTNATFSSAFVQNQINKARGDLLLLVDEAHNFGADNLKRLLSPKFNYRLALSATLDRHGDPEGTEALYNYFGDKCIEYDLDRAIEEKKLTPYKYYPVIVYLSDEERDEYDFLSRQIAKCLIKGKKGKFNLSEKGKKLALKRARLVAGAISKIDKLEEEIKPYIEDKHLLVYCGATRILGLDEEYTGVDDEDIRQIDAVTGLLGNKLGMKVSQFTSKEDVDERNILKQEFAEGDNLQALIAIKCLDEGVNIPKIKVAFILASTTNPKEYIQRRGRVLRKSEGKDFAEIYDFITLPRPIDEAMSITGEQLKRELTLVKNELCRAEEFARLAINKVSANSIIDEIKEAYDLQDYVLDFMEEYYDGNE